MHRQVGSQVQAARDSTFRSGRHSYLLKIFRNNHVVYVTTVILDGSDASVYTLDG